MSSVSAAASAPASVPVVTAAANVPVAQPVPGHLDLAWRFMSANPSAVVAIFGIVVTILLFWLGARRNRMEATFKALELVQAKDAREARFGLRDILSSNAEHKGDFSKMKSTERATVSSIVLLFGFIGALGRRGRIDLNVFFDAFASSIVVNHERMRAYSQWRDSYRPYQDGTLWKDFDWLSEHAKLYLARRGDPNRLRSLLSRTGLVRPPWESITALEASAHSPLPSSSPPASDTTSAVPIPVAP